VNTEAIANTAEKVKVALSDINVTDFFGRYKDTYHAAQRGAKGIEETRRRIKSHPIRSIAVIGSAAFILGSLAGWALARGRRA
jgi:hypothetical protein